MGIGISLRRNGCCETCIYWLQDARWLQTTRGERLDQTMWGACELTITGDDERGLPTKAIAQDTEEYEAWLNTHALFGCNQWEEKTNESP